MKGGLDAIVAWMGAEGEIKPEGKQRNKDPLSRAGFYYRRGIINLNSPCSVCQSYEDVQMHHVKSLKALKGRDPYMKHIIGLKIRQIPLCREHHLTHGHGGKWKGKAKDPKKTEAGE